MQEVLEMVVNISRLTSSENRTPKQKFVTIETDRSYKCKCRRDIRKHHELLKDDPERLTTEFLLEITGCECIRVRK
jgi:hypothetical protein